MHLKISQFKMDITSTAIKLQKEIEKLENKLKDGTARSYKEINEIRAKKHTLEAALRAVLAKL